MRGWEEAYWILETKERGGRSREWRVAERMGKGRAEGKEMEKTRGRKGGREGRMVVTTQMNLDSVSQDGSLKHPSPQGRLLPPLPTP